MTSNLSTHDHAFYRDTFRKQMQSWHIPLEQIVGVTTDGDAAVVKVGQVLDVAIWVPNAQAYRKGLSELGDLYWQRCTTHLTSNLLKGAVAAVDEVSRVLAIVDAIVLYHRASPHRRAVLSDCARRAPCAYRTLIRVCC